jgi:hypothetical protein
VSLSLSWCPKLGFFLFLFMLVSLFVSSGRAGEPAAHVPPVHVPAPEVEPLRVPAEAVEEVFADPVEEADRLKERGNAAFKGKRYSEAIDLYTEAIGALLSLHTHPRRSSH